MKGPPLPGIGHMYMLHIIIDMFTWGLEFIYSSMRAT